MKLSGGTERREGEKEGGREGGKKGGRKEGREEGGRAGGKKGGREGGREGGHMRLYLQALLGLAFLETGERQGLTEFVFLRLQLVESPGSKRREGGRERGKGGWKDKEGGREGGR